MLWEVSSRAEEKTEETSWNFGKEVKTSSALPFLCEDLICITWWGGAALRLPSDNKWWCMPSITPKYLKILCSLYMYTYAYLLMNRLYFQTKLNTSSPEGFLTLIMQWNRCEWPIPHSNLCGNLERRKICLWIPVKTNCKCVQLWGRVLSFILMEVLTFK